MRVLELSDREEAAAFATKLFRRWGAEVVKVESPDRTRPERHLDIYLNGGKDRVTLDRHLATESDRLSDLASKTDIVVTDYAPEEIDRLGLMNPENGNWPAVRVSVTPFGLSGPYRSYEATASTLLALGGYTYLMGDPGRAPLTMPGNYVYYQAGTYAYLSALAAHTFGSVPAAIEVSILETLAGLHQFTDTMWTFGGIVRSRHGNRWENLCPTTLLPTADGWYGVNILQNFWFPFAHMIGRPDIASDGELSTNQGRMDHQDEVEAMITSALGDLPKKQIFKSGQESWRVPIGYAATLAEVIGDPHLVERGFLRPVEVSDDDVAPPHTLLTAGSPFSFVGEERPEELAVRPTGSPGSTTPPDRPMSATVRAGDPPRDPVRPLAGVRVLDLTRIWSGPLATRILGDLGAELIKVEAPPQAPPEMRPRPSGAPPPRPGALRALTNKLNRNKRSVVLDLKIDRARRVFLDMVAKSDVVIENFSARAMPGLGLSYETLKQANEQIIYVPMPAFGLFGPYRDYIGLGPSIEPTTGLTAIMGYSDSEPRVTAKALTDAIAGTSTAAAVITALERRAKTGKGCQVDLSQHEMGVAFIGEFLIEAQLSGSEPTRMGNSHREYAPHGVYRCAGDDEWIALAVRGDRDWRALCAVLPGGSVESSPSFTSADARRANRHQLDEEIERLTITWRKRDLEAALQARGIAAGSVLPAPEYLSDPHLVARKYFVELTGQDGPIAWDGSPLKINGKRGYEHWFGAPDPGEHSRSILGDLLGIDDAELDRMAREGVLTDSHS